MLLPPAVLLVLFAAKASCRMEWKDPHDMSAVLKTLDKNPDFYANEMHHDARSENHCHNPPTAMKHLLIHYKRLVNQILQLVKFDKVDQNTYKATVNLNIHTDDYDYLKEFTESSEISESTLRKIDNILSRQFETTSANKLFDTYLTWTDHLYLKIFNSQTMVLLACVFALVVSYKLLKARFTVWTVVKYLLLLFWITDTYFTWMSLLQEAESNSIADSLKYKNVPPHCKPDEMTWWQYTWSFLYPNDDCREYHKIMLNNVFYTVAPFKVISHQVGIVILTPAASIGKAFGDLVSGMMGSLPIGLNVILLPIMLLFFCVITCLVLSFATNTKFSVNIFHMLKFQFGDGERRRLEDTVSGQNLRSLLNLVDRDAIEDVRDDNSGNSGKGNGNKLRDCSKKQKKRSNKGDLEEGKSEGKEGKTERKEEKIERKELENGEDICVCNKSKSASDTDNEKSDSRVTNVHSGPSGDA